MASSRSGAGAVSPCSRPQPSWQSGCCSDRAHPRRRLRTGPAPIEQRNSSTVTADPLPTVQIDSGIVWTQEVVGNTVFAGGSFSNARPAGAAPGTNLIPRSNILAYNLTTGVITPFAPQINGQVKVIKASPDGSRIYVGGSFNSIGGQTQVEHRRVRCRDRRALDDVQARRRRVVRQRDRGHELRGLRRRPDRRGGRGRPQEPRRVQHERRPARMGADHRPAGRQHGADAVGRQAHRRGSVRNGQQCLPAWPRGARPQLRCDPALDCAQHRDRTASPSAPAGPARRASGSSRRTPTPSTAPDGSMSGKTVGNLEGLFSAEPGKRRHPVDRGLPRRPLRRVLRRHERLLHRP